MFCRDFLEIVGSRLALYRRVRRNDELAHFAALEPRFQLIEPKFGRTDAIDRRQAAQQHKVLASETGGPFDGDDVTGGLDYTQQLPIPTRALADIATAALREVPAALAVSNLIAGLMESRSQVPRAVPVSF
jgi:hypothetical protein